MKKQSRKRKLQCIQDESERCLKTEDGAEFYIDPEVLSRNSKYFKSLFLYNSLSDILISGIPGKTLRLIVNFLQNKTVMLNSDNVIPLLEAADYFVLEEFSRKILCTIPDLICKENIIHLYHAALNLNHLTLYEVVHTYMLAHFHMVAVQSDIGELCLEHFDKLLSDPNLMVRDEGMVWNVIVKWVKADEKPRRESVPLLLSHIRPELCSKSFIENFFQHPLIQKNEFCERITAFNIVESPEYSVLRYRFITCLRCVTPMQLNLDPRVPRMEFNVIYSKTDQRNEMKIAIGPVEGKTKATVLAKKLDYVPKSVFLFDRRKICIFDEFESPIEFDLTRKTWVKRTPLNEDLNGLFSVSTLSPLDSNLYAISVEYNPTAHVVASIYDFRSVKWTRLSSCSLTSDVGIKIETLKSLGLDGLIFVAAMGTENGRLTSLTKIFNPKMNTWSSSFNLPNEFTLRQRIDFTMASLKGILYFIGSDSNIFHRFNLTSKAWMRFQLLPFSYKNPFLKVVQERVILFEKDENRQPIKWIQEIQIWVRFRNEIHFLLELQDEDVRWRCYCEFRRREWKALANEWKSRN